MTEPMKIRAQAKGDITEIRVLMNHPMETGQRKDSAGNLIAPHHIQTLSIDVAGKRVIQGQTGTAVSRNPLFVFKVRGPKAGDEVVISWTDNKGNSRSDKAVVI